MGWNGGTKIFDTVASIVESCLEEDADCELQELAEDVLCGLIFSLHKQDWDNGGESDYWEHPIIGRMLGNTFEEDEDE